MASNTFWKWFRLREGRTIYRASVEVRHRDGTPCTIIVEGAHAEYVAALLNGIKAKYSIAAASTVEPNVKRETSVDPFEDFAAFLEKERKNCL